ncbi:hypothetical protein EPN44_06475 [bacterium]|nr:MAG: hypothetical protein EPN44_06475 [bacterium]
MPRSPSASTVPTARVGRPMPPTSPRMRTSPNVGPTSRTERCSAPCRRLCRLRGAKTSSRTTPRGPSSAKRNAGETSARRRTGPSTMRRYFTHFGLARDPFLDTADPEFFCETPRVRESMTRLESSIADGRGLVIVTGPVGAGKTSLSGALELSCLKDESVAFGKILDPAFGSETEMLIAIGRVFGLNLPPRSSASLKNALKNLFFDMGVLENRAIVLIIDEAQSLEPFGLEVLRLLLNYQVPEKKLLNVLLFGQPELGERIRARQNVADRVDQWIELRPLDPGELAVLLAHRLHRAGLPEGQRIFSDEAMNGLVRASGGYPRRAIVLGHAAMVAAAESGAGGVFSEHLDEALRRTGSQPLPFVTAEAAAPAVGIAPLSPELPEPPVDGSPAEPRRGWWASMLQRLFPSAAGERR